MDAFEIGWERAGEVLSGSSASGILFVLEAQSENPRFDEVTMMDHAGLFITWDENYTGPRGSIVNENGALYKAMHDIGAGQRGMRPSATPTLYKQIGNPGDEWPMWSQPIAGVDLFYRIGDKVSHKGKHWTCSQENTAQGNSYEPGVWGWTEVT